MKILLATDGSPHSETMVKEPAGRTFAANTKMHIISAYEGGSYMLNIAPMGALSQYYTEADSPAIKAAEDANENAAVILRKKILSFLYPSLQSKVPQKKLSGKKQKHLVPI